MGRDKLLTHKSRINLWIIDALDRRLEEFQKTSGWSKTQIIEVAIACFLNAREMEKREREVKRGLAEVKQ